MPHAPVACAHPCRFLSFLLAFIIPAVSAAVAVAFASIASTFFSLALATDAEQLHGRTRLLRWSPAQRLLLGRPPWKRVPGVVHSLKLRLAGCWAASPAQLAIVAAVDTCAALCERLCRIGRARRLSSAAGAGVAPRNESVLQKELVEHAATFSRVAGACRSGALLVLYAAWGVSAWIILVYGKRISQLLGPREQQPCLVTWAVGVGLGQALEARAALASVLHAAAALTTAETLWLTSNARWLEDTVDFMSVHATMARSAAGASTARVYSRFHKGTTRACC